MILDCLKEKEYNWPDLFYSSGGLEGVAASGAPGGGYETGRVYVVYQTKDVSFTQI